MIRCIMCGRPTAEDSEHLKEMLAQHSAREAETGINQRFVYICPECDLRNRADAEREGKGLYHPHRKA